MLVPPFVLLDRYDVSEEIGRGGHAIVYRAHDRVLDRAVAVKLLRGDVLSDDTLARFRREVAVTAQLEHAHILHVYDTGSFEGQPFVVMELATGRTLAQRIDREGQLPVSDALAIARDVGQALAHAHARGVVHRDVKPDNILIGSGGAILADFGIASVMQEGVVRQLTSSGVAVGTVQYMSPEQLCAEKGIDGRSDQYALACVLYEMLAGVRPHIAASVEGLRLLRMTGATTPVRVHRPSVSAPVDAAVQTALSSMPADRFRNVDEFLAALGVGASGEFNSHSMGAGDQRSSGAAIVAAGRSHPRNVDVRGAARTSGATNAAWLRHWWLPMGGVVLMSSALLLLKGTSLGTGDSGNTSRGAIGAQIVALANVPGDSASLDGRVHAALRAELSGWTDVELTERTRSTDTLALTFVPTVVALGDSVGIRLDVQSRAPAFARRLAATVPMSDRAALRSAVSLLVRQALGGTDMSNAPGAESLRARSLVALRAYVRGFARLRAGQFDSATMAFRESAHAAPGFGKASFWAGQSGAWHAPRDVATWRIDADNAVKSGSLRGVDSTLAAALVDMSRARFPEACGAYRAATSRAPDLFEAWFGLGECARLDSVVVNRGGMLQFRSSHWTALAAYREAVQRAPTSEWLASLFPWILRTTYAEGSRARAGRTDDGSTIYFYSYPSLGADTMAFYPIEQSAFNGSNKGSMPLSWVRAIRRGRATLLDLTHIWVTRWQDSPAAWFNRAIALELWGSIADNRDEDSAESALERAAAGQTSELMRAQVEVARARLALRRGDVRAAASIARSAVVRSPSGRSDVRATLAPLAALIGDVDRTLQLSLPDVEASNSIPASLSDSILAFRLRALLGACEGLGARRSRLDEMFRQQFSLPDLAAQRQRLLIGAYRDAVPCLGPASVAEFRAVVPIDAVYQSLQAGDLNAARKTLVKVRLARAGATPAFVTWDYLFVESWALLQVGDSLVARALLTDALQDAINLNPFTLSQSAQAAGFRRGLALLAQLSRSRVPEGMSRWQEQSNQLQSITPRGVVRP